MTLSTATTLGRLRIIKRFRLRGVEFPVAAFTLPKRLQGHPNGAVPDDMLVTWTDHKGRTCRMAAEFRRPWVALVWLAYLHTGLRLTFTSSADVYRTRPQQVAGWERRMTRVPLPGRPSRMCGHPDGVQRRWWLKPLMAGIACPAGPWWKGGSNHGWFGAAVDHNTDKGRPVWWLKWAVIWFPAFGYSWEASTEDWHTRYCAGDDTPDAVVEVEACQKLATVKRGDTGAVVKLVQTIVGATPDGQFGPQTEAKVIAWQKFAQGTYKGVRTDGVWDAGCWWIARAA